MSLKACVLSAIAATLITSAVSHAEDFDFTFTGPIFEFSGSDHYPATGTVSGLINGLQNGISSPTSVEVTSSPFSSSIIVFTPVSFPPGTEFPNTFFVNGGNIVEANYGGAASSFSLGFVGPGGGFESANASIAVNNVTFGPAISAAPEPTTWALMILGLGGVGLALQRPTKAKRFDQSGALPA